MDQMEFSCGGKDIQFIKISPKATSEAEVKFEDKEIAQIQLDTTSEQIDVKLTHIQS
jgi:hypothetical protein